MRPLGISCYEDKLVENAIAQILEQIYEPQFYDESYGFRRNRNCHKAVKKVVETVRYRKTNYVVEADIRGFFDNVDHDWLMKMLAHDIADRKFPGFTFYCGTDAKKRFFRCKVKTSRKKLHSKSKTGEIFQGNGRRSGNDVPGI